MVDFSDQYYMSYMFVKWIPYVVFRNLQIPKTSFFFWQPFTSIDFSRRELLGPLCRELLDPLWGCGPQTIANWLYGKYN